MSGDFNPVVAILSDYPVISNNPKWKEEAVAGYAYNLNWLQYFILKFIPTAYLEHKTGERKHDLTKEVLFEKEDAVLKVLGTHLTLIVLSTLLKLKPSIPLEDLK